MKKIKSPVRKAEPYLWLLPAFVLFAVFTFIPFLQTLWKSLFIVDAFGNIRQFVAFENYAYILSDPRFRQAFLSGQRCL